MESLPSSPAAAPGSATPAMAAGMGSQAAGLGSRAAPAPPRSRPFQTPRPAQATATTDQASQEAGQTSSRVPKKKAKSQEIPWNPENTRIICKLFAEQVGKGNRPNTHLNSNAYEEIEDRFNERTGLQANKDQIKNKWDKLKAEFKAWRKLMRRQTGTGWDSVKGTIKMDDEWWAKARKDIPGCGKFRKLGLQNETELEQMYGDITNDGGDHWNPMCPDFETETIEPINLDSQEEDGAAIGGAEIGENGEEDVPRPLLNDERKASVPATDVADKGKKVRTGTALCIQEAVTRIADSAVAIASKKEAEISITEVMQHVLECGATFESNEYYIATELFVKKERREMFMTLPPGDLRFNWLKRKYNEKFET